MEDLNDLYENQLFDLLESKEYETLTPKERRFVDEQLGETDFCLQQRIMREADQIEGIKEASAALVLRVPASFWKKPLPLYQAVLAIAAIFIVFFSVRFVNDLEPSKTMADVNDYDTVFSTKYVHDTIIHTVTQLRYVYSKVVDTATPVVAESTPEEFRLLAAPNTIVLPKLTEELLSTKGKSLMEDPVSQFIPRMMNLND